MVQRLRQQAAVVGIGLVGFVLPFDLDAVVWSISGHNIRPVHALVAVFLLSIVGMLWGPNSPFQGSFEPNTDRIMFVLAGLLILSTLFASQYQVVATVSLRRLLTGIALTMLVRHLIHTEREARLVLAGLVFGASLACLLGLFLLTESPGSDAGELFRGRTVMFGPVRRFTLPFPHANIAGAYLGASLVLGLGLLTDSLRRGLRNAWLTRLYGACCLVLGIALTLTISRSAVIATVTILLCLVATTVSSRLWTEQFPSLNGRWVIGGALLLILAGVAANPAWHVRLADPGNAHWYQVQILAPDTATLAAPPESILVRNQSDVSWPSSGFNSGLVAISLDANGAELRRTLFPLPALTPSTSDSNEEDGSAVHVDASELIIDKDSAVIVWDVFRSGQGHFRGLAGQSVVATAVSGQPMPVVIKLGHRFRPGTSGLDPIPGRTQLWSAARALALSRPLLGVGPGNFRLHYQSVIDVNGPQNTHAHSILFEPLASWGIPATAIFLFLIMRVGLRALTSVREPLELVVLAAFALLVIANLTDWTLASASGGLLFWLLLGLTSRIDGSGYGSEPT